MSRYDAGVSGAIMMQKFSLTAGACTGTIHSCA